jgi:hypothetical protein
MWAMIQRGASMSESIALPPARICIGVTGHRDTNPAFAANHDAIEAAVTNIFESVARVTSQQNDIIGTTRLYSLMALGADAIAIRQALQQEWEVVAPLPFGLDLNIAINSEPETASVMTAVLAGRSSGSLPVDGRASQLREMAAILRLFELAEQDSHVTELLLHRLSYPDDIKATQDYLTIVAERVATAGRVMIEQSDILIAIWDGVTPGAIGGTRHTIAAAVSLGTPVIWIDASQPANIHVLRTPEELFALEALPRLDTAGVEALFEATLNPPSSDQNERAIRFHTELWHRRSHRRFHAYRRIEALFGGKGWRGRWGRLVQTYEPPKDIARGTGAAILESACSLPGGDAALVERIEVDILQRFAWADGLSTYLSDAYRGGMVTNFLLSAMAIVVGVAYLPLASVDAKWPFALSEFVLLACIIGITTIGRRKRWHGRWFETRRVAEYFRHAPVMLLLGVARSTGRWPHGAETEWPEYYAREVLCDIGLPSIKIEQGYLRVALQNLLQAHATRQRIYHQQKAMRLTRVHHGLDRLSEILFALAVLSVFTYLSLIALGTIGVVPGSIAHDLSKLFTFFGVILPALGGAFAGIRYFGDFERFAAISEVTAEKLEEVERRISLLLGIKEGQLRYSQIADLAHAIDDIVVSEIENWQSVFGSKQIAVPV